ncbi:PQQ-binding-like beta-propeller repeat protein [Haloquadratum walsbyi]|jgi:FOG: WD40-like repeat|uniref:Pyrrolo-quinoline quinone repeat domain-containing protein n=1 Tax=Haloquadratum walsbyi J07HQW2 TaxID=1238425 RepID=U1MTY9_9EURY|nr:PQQ-binding-like beta-propeller repeat protein [Haloquadratum walsbyi]ERG93764.1 MAG: hypothetical protein J07HQW2_00198 [Haloquadratum walsbyi J07HQW2]
MATVDGSAPSTQFGGRAVVRDAESGKIKWRSEDRKIADVYPPITQDVVIVGSTDGTLYGYDASSGKIQCEHTMGSKLSGLSTSDTHIFYTADQRVFAYNPSTGEIDWRQRIPPASRLTYDQKLL